MGRTLRCGQCVGKIDMNQSHYQTLKMTTTAFRQGFPRSTAAKSGCGRASWSMKASGELRDDILCHVDITATALKDRIPEGAMPDPQSKLSSEASQEFKDLNNLQVYGFTDKMTHESTEKRGMATFKLSLADSDSKHVVAIPMASLVEWIESQQKSVTAESCKQAVGSLAAASRDNLEKWGDSAPRLYHATIAAGSLLYMTCGWVLIETALGAFGYGYSLCVHVKHQCAARLGNLEAMAKVLASHTTTLDYAICNCLLIAEKMVHVSF